MIRFRSPLRLVGALAGALLGVLALVLALQGGARAEGTGTDPAIGAITATASIPISDTRPGEGISRTIYFNNNSDGVLTLTLEITGTTPLTLTSRPAFGDAPDVLTSGAVPWQAVVTYSVEATDTNDYPGVPYTVTNGAGNEVVVVITYTRDVTAPQVTISSPPSGAVLTTTHQPQVVITGTASDSRSGVAWVDVTTGTTWVSATGTANWSYNWSLPEVDGQVYTLTARAQDHAGNWGASAGVTVTVDTKAPGSNTPSPHKSPWVTSTVVYTWNASSDNSGISGYWANITNTAGYTAFFWVESSPSPALTFTGALTEGAGYVARVQAVDGVGNVGEWSGSSTVVTPDLTAPNVFNPQIAVGTGVTYFYVSGLTLFYTNTMPSADSFTVKGNASDGGPSGLDKATFSQAFGQTPGDDTTPSVFGGSYDVSPGVTESGRITVTVYDKAGNAAFQIYTYTLDGDPPYTGSVTIAGGAEYVSSTAVSLALSSADAGCGVGGMCITHTLSCADTDWKPYTTTLTWTLAGPDGVNTVYAWFRDHLRNAAGPYTDTVILDRLAPSGTVTIAEGSAYTTGITVTLSLTASDATSGVEGMCVSNADTCFSSWEPFTSTKVWTLDGTSDGEKTVYVWFRDRAGNVGGPFTDTILLDRQPPVVAIFYPSAGDVLTTTHRPQVVITGTASDSGSGVAWVDVTTGTTWVSATGTANWSYNWSLPEVDGQVYTLTARAQDHAGNWGASAGVTVTVDTVAPGADAPNPHRSPWVTSTVVYTWNASSDNSGISGYRVNITNTAGYTAFFWVESSPSPALTFTEALTEGAGYYARVQAVDGVGNAGGWSGLSAVVTPDLTAPRVVVTAPTQIATTPFTVSWSAEDDLSGPSGTYSVYYREDSGAWRVWLASTTLTQATFVSGTLEHTYVFSVTTADRAGNVGQGSATTKVAKWRVYIPLVLRNWKPLTNGSFEDGLAGWTVTQSPLPVSIVNNVQERTGGTTGPADGSRILLLGNPDYPCNGVPLGYAAVEQTFVVPHDAVSLTFKYIIWTQDASPVNRYDYDLFEVYLNEERKFDDTNRHTTGLGCNNWWRVPGPDNPRNGVTTGWAPATLDLRPYRGQMVTLSFRLYSRADNWYNTYVYIDDVQIVR